jgi:hypothetical protein
MKRSQIPRGPHKIYMSKRCRNTKEALITIALKSLLTAYNIIKLIL